MTAEGTLRQAIAEVLHRWDLIEREVHGLRNHHVALRLCIDRLLTELETYAAQFGRVAVELEEFAVRLARAADRETPAKGSDDG